MLEWPDYRVAGENMVFIADGEFVEEDVYRSEGVGFWIEERRKGCLGLGDGV